MKNYKLAPIILAALAAGSLAVWAETDPNVATTNAVTTSTNSTSVTVTLTAASPATNASPSTNAAETADLSDAPVMATTNALRMNFHDAPLKTVLSYLSARMGFVVVSEPEIHGTATIVSEQPVGTNEVIELLSGALAKNNYMASLNGRILTISTADSFKTQTPVKQAASPDKIPINDEMATYILPVHTLNPTQLIKDLDQLIPPGATVAANEAGNAVIMTARQRDIHRFAEIIAALDGSSVSQVEVFLLHFADAKAVATELKEVFQSPDSSVARSDTRQRFRGGGGFAAMFNGSGNDGGNNTSDQKNAANKAVFTSDDQMNAVIASAPPDYFPMITNVIRELDQASQEVTLMKVFFLTNADPQEMADELANLFPDETKTSNDQNTRSAGMRFLPPWMQQQTPASTKSERMTLQTTVRAVPDPRTQSLIVTASSNTMEQIAGVIAALDKSTAGVQGEYRFSLKNADPLTVQAALTTLFAGQNYKPPTSTTATSALQQRQTTAAQQTTTTTTGLSSSGTGTPASH